MKPDVRDNTLFISFHSFSFLTFSRYASILFLGILLIDVTEGTKVTGQDNNIISFERYSYLETIE